MELALEFLRSVGCVLKESALYSTTPVGMPLGTDMFLNQAVVLDCPDEPEVLLRKIKEFERRMGRDLKNSHYADRTIDIDILLAERKVLGTGELTIPHPRMDSRGFVLIPLAEIAPEAFHPILEQTVASLLAQLKTKETVEKL